MEGSAESVEIALAPTETDIKEEKQEPPENGKYKHSLFSGSIEIEELGEKRPTTKTPGVIVFVVGLRFRRRYWPSILGSLFSGSLFSILPNLADTFWDQPALYR